MLSHPPLGFFRLPRPHRLNDAPVLFEGGFHTRRKTPGRQPKNSDVVAEGGNQADETAGLRKGYNGLVKFQVFLSISLDIFLRERLLESLYAGLQFHEAGLADFLCSHGSSQPFKAFADEKKLEDILLRKLNDKSAPLGKNFDKAFLLQAIDRLPNRSPADPQRLGNFALLDLFSRIHLPIENDAFQPLIGLTSKRKIRLTNSLHKGSPNLYNLYIMHFCVSSFFV